MHLKQLTISGFKSFGDKGELEFAPGITAIVGPNGSGKSNIADAVRWALGEQSTKQLRGKKNPDLIFAGAEKRARASLAEVTLVIDNGEGSVKVPHSEISITRRLYRSAEGEYLLNGKVVRLTDVVTLLAEAGFGQSTYTVISQGMVDSLLVNTPAERKALFDEAVGVRPYYLKRDQALRELRATEENLERIRSILRELSPHLASLERTAKRAAERATLEEEFHRLARTYYGGRLGELERKIEEKQKLKSELAREVERVEREVASLEQGLSSAPKVGEDTETEKAREALRSLQRERDEAAKQLALIEGRLQAAREGGGGAEHRSLLERLSRLKAEEKELVEKLGTLRRRANAAQREEQAAAKERDRRSDQLAKLQKELAELEQRQDPEAEVRPLVLRARELVTEIRDGGGEPVLSALEEVLVRIETALSPELAATASDLRKRIREQEHALRKSVELLQELMAERAGITSLLLDAEARSKDLSREIQGAEQSVAKLGKTEGAEAKHLEDEHALQRKMVVVLEHQIREQQDLLSRFETGFRDRVAATLENRSSLSEKQTLLRSYGKELTELEVELARLETRREDLAGEILRELGPKALGEIRDSRAKIENPTETEQRLARLRTRLAALPTGDPEITAEYEELKERHEFLSGQGEDLEKGMDNLKQVVTELEGVIKRQFDERFREIAGQFTRYFKELFGGGKAEITLEAVSPPADGGEVGIEIRATPPGKRLAEISALSGGERALTAAALLSAILTVNPSPFVVLDEVDAALDEANTVKFGKVLKSLAEKTQFIVITHNRRTMELAGVLYGVTMDEGGVSRILSLKLEEAAVAAGTE